MTPEEKQAEIQELIDRYGEEAVLGAVSDAQKRIVAEEAQEVLENAEFQLDKALDTYDPTFPRYEPSKHAFEFFTLMRLVQGKDFEFNTPIAHYFMVDLLLGEITDPMMFPYSEEVCKTIEINHLRLAFMCSRGMAKSSVVISFFGVYSAIKGELPNGIGEVWFYLVLAASSRGGARVNALAVRAMCEDSVFLNDYFEEMRFTESESEFTRKGTCARKDRSFLIRYQGIGTGVRGIRYGERRICHIIFDDIILNESAAYSKTITENLESMIHSDAVAALKGGGKGRITNCFTPFHYTDVNTKTVLEGAYTPCVIPIAADFDADSVKSAYEITSSWEAMHPRTSIMQMIKDARKSKKLGAFLQERMLRLTSGADRLVPDRCIQYCDMKAIENNLEGYNVYITTDYTTTSGEKSDFAGVGAWAVNSNQDYFLLDLYLRKMGMDTQYAVTLELAAKYKRKGKNVEIGVEVDGNQSAHLHALEKLMREHGVYYSFAKQKGQLDSSRKGLLSKNASGKSKHERFKIAAQQSLLQNKLWFPEHLKDTPDMREMETQIKGATHESFTRADDGLDLITQLIVTMHIYYPTYEASVQLTSNNGIPIDKNTHVWGEGPSSRSAYDNY